MNLHPLMLMGFLICNLGFWPLFITLARAEMTASWYSADGILATLDATGAL